MSQKSYASKLPNREYTNFEYTQMQRETIFIGIENYSPIRTMKHWVIGKTIFHVKNLSKRAEWN